jgi:hypothetical protein
MIFGLGFLQLIQRGFDHCRRELLRGKSITPTNDFDARTIGLDERVNDVEVEWLTGGARFFGAVKYRNRLHTVL